MSVVLHIDVTHHILFESSPDSRLARILEGVLKLENQMSKQDDSITALAAAFETIKGNMSTSLDNISADEAAILAKLNGLDDLTPANQAKVDSITADFTTLAAKTQAIADSIPDTVVPVP